MTSGRNWPRLSKLSERSGYYANTALTVRGENSLDSTSRLSKADSYREGADGEWQKLAWPSQGVGARQILC